MFKNTKKILKGLGKTALGVGAIVSVAVIAYGATNATISADAAKVANMTAGNKQVTMQIIKENSPLSVKYSNLISPVMDKILGINDSGTAVDYFVNKACDEAFEKFQKGSLEYQNNSKISKSNSSNSLEQYVSKNIDSMKDFQLNIVGDKDLVEYVNSNTNKEDLVKSFIKEFKGQTKTDVLDTLEKGLNSGKILAYNDYKGKMTQNHSEDSLKDKYHEYTKLKINDLSKEQSISSSIEYDNSKQISL
ncbi:hypothetical protein [Aliarcobacter butzleri]|uniref:hypothetical protein n=1 Tax=Aliarcobacter butzleri TaxID=28197 RepID=UPI00126A11BA|nr:hypothetical protein [Aliarcobacter butzleri]